MDKKQKNTKKLKNINDDMCFEYAVMVALNHENKEKKINKQYWRLGPT